MGGARRAGAAWLLAVLVATGQARTQSAEPVFREAERAYAQGDYRAAALGFERAHGLQPHGAALYNAGLSWESLGELAHAADAYEETLVRRGDLDTRQEQDSRARLRRLSAQLGQLDITGPAGSQATVAGFTTTVPGRRYAPPGRQRIVLRYASGEQASTEVQVEAGKVVAVSFVAGPSPTSSATSADRPLPAPSSTPPERPPLAPSSPVAPPPPLPTAGTERRPSTGTRVLTYGLLAGGALTLGLSLYAGSQALGARDEYNASGHTDRDARDRAMSLRTWTNVGLGVGAALAGVGAVLWVSLPARTSVSVGARGLSVGGSF